DKLGTNFPSDSPEGTRNHFSVPTGVPKFGVPSAFQLNFCILTLRVQPAFSNFAAWYMIQSSVPSGDFTNPLCPGPYTSKSGFFLNIGVGFFSQASGFRGSVPSNVSIPKL